MTSTTTRKSTDLIADVSNQRGARVWRPLRPGMVSLAGCVVLICFEAGEALTQDLRPVVHLQPAAGEETVTPELVEARRREAAESPDLSEDAKKKADEHYRLAAEGLKKTTDLGAAAATFRRDTDDVQQRLRLLKYRLAELQSLKPAAPSLDTLPKLEQERSRRDVQLTELKAQLARAEAEPSARAGRRKDIRGALLSGGQRIADVDRQLAAPAPTDEPTLLTLARTTELRVRRLMIEAELPALQNELAKYDAEDAADYVRLERDVRTQEVALAEAELKLFDGVIEKMRAEENAAALRRARDAAIAAQPLLTEAAQLNEELAALAVKNTEPINTARSRLDDTRTRLEGLRKQFTATQQRVRNIGLSGAIGALLRQQRSELPNVTKRRANVRDRRELIEDTQYELFDYDDQRAALASRDPHVNAILDLAPPTISPLQRERLEAAARDVFDHQAEYLDQLIRSYNTLLDTLFELDETEQQLIIETERYTTYIDERVLWIRSNDLLFSTLDVDDSDVWILQPRRWLQVGEALLNDGRKHIWLYLVFAVVFMVLVSSKRRIRQQMDSAGALAARGTCTSCEPTWRAAWLTLLMAVTWPGLVWCVGTRLSAASGRADFAQPVAQGLLMVAYAWLPLELLRRICRNNGLADHHFDWPESTVRVFRRTLPRLIVLAVPLVGVTMALHAGDTQHGVDLPERVLFIASVLVLTAFLRNLLRPETGILHEYLAAHPEGWHAKTRWLWYGGSLLAPLSLAGLAATGFYYTAQQLAWRLFETILFVLLLQLMRAFLQRLIIVQRRKLSIEHARQQRAGLAAREALNAQATATLATATSSRAVSSVSESADADAPATPVELSSSDSGVLAAGTPRTALVPAEELRADVESSTEQSRRLLGTAIVVASVVGVWMIWIDVLPALRVLDQWRLWATTVDVPAEDVGLTGPDVVPPGRIPGAVPLPETDAPIESRRLVTVIRYVTPRHIALALLAAIVTAACARNIPGLMEMWVLQQLPLDQSVRYAVTSLTRYVILLLGVILTFNAISVGWSKVQWLATALTFGLAFGLQEIFANFVAGLILLFERPIRIGDVVTVEDVTGVVSRIRIRATTITNWDRKEYVIPNKEFITGRMLNWTLTDSINRVVINVGIAYGSDVEKAKELLLKVCHDHPLVLDQPRTLVTFEGFGDSSLNFVVRTFLPDMDNRLIVIDALHTNIDKAFRESGIEIAFPQRDLHLRSVDSTIADALQKEPVLT